MLYVPVVIAGALDPRFTIENYTDLLHSMGEEADEWIVDNLVTDKESYYYGRVTGDCITMIAGIAGMGNGLMTIAGGITLTGGGIVMTSSGVLAWAGVPAIAISVPVVATGVLEMAGSASIAYSGYNNMNDHIQKINEINSSPDKPDIGDIKKAELADEVKEAVNEFDRTKPSNKYNVNSKPSGHETKISKKADEATRRSLKRENEAAITLAQNGYQIEQNPNLSYTSRKPDYLIEGNVFDCYSPAEKTSPNNIRSTINEKVMIKQQTERVVLNLDDWKGNVDDILSALEDNPIEDLKEVLVVQNGQVFGIYP